MTNAKRTGYTFSGWYEDAEYTTKWSGTTMPARGLTLYAKWDVLTYILRFDWDGNVPLKNWLLGESIGGEMLTATYDEADYEYINANDHGIPYIDVTVEYDEEFDFPTDIPGAQQFGYYKGNGEFSPATGVEKMATEQDVVVMIGAEWKPNATDSNGAELIYTAGDFLNKVVQDYSYDAASYALGADLDLCNAIMMPQGDTVGGITFYGNHHTIFNVKRGETLSSYAAGAIYGYGDNMTVKDLTIDGITVDYTAAVDTGGNCYRAFGALAGFVGDGFTAENVTVKNVTIDLNLLGEEAYAYSSAHRLPAESIGGLIGCAKGRVTLTDCTVENMTVNVIDKNDEGGTKFLIGGLIGYADALYTPYDADGNYADNDYRGDGRVSITGCTVDMTVSKNDAQAAAVGGFLGGIGKSVTSKTETEYSVTVNIDDASTFPAGFESVGEELIRNDSKGTADGNGTDESVSGTEDSGSSTSGGTGETGTGTDDTGSGESAAQSPSALLPAAFEDEPDEENAAA